MPKQSMRKSKSKSRGRKHSRKTKVQRGGVSNACVLDTATGTSVLQSNGLANLHNINPQASLDLDNKFMAYGGPVPLGSTILQGGASRCGDEGVGTRNGKPETFKQYLDGVSKTLDGAMKGGGGNQPDNSDNSDNSHNEGLGNEPNTVSATSTTGNNGPDPNNSDEGALNQEGPILNMFNNKKNMGGGSNNITTPPFYAPMKYSTKQSKKMINPQYNVGKPIPNQLPIIQQNPQVVANIYSPPEQNVGPTKGGGFSTDPGEFIGGMPVYKAYDDCCPPAIVNGQLKFGAPDQAVCGFGAVKGGSRKRVNGMKKKNSNKQQRKTRSRKQRSHNGTQRGGDWTVATRSKPAMFDEAFNGPASVFAYPDDMSKRTFGETQPNYTPNAI